MPATSTQPIRTQFRIIDGLSIRFAESEARDDHALLLSPWPETLYAYEPTWQRLAEKMHLIAIDLPGFGHSEWRDALLSPRAMGHFLVRVADSFRLEHPHVVGPDVGTAAALFAAADFPHRFRSLTIGTGAASVPLELGGVLKQWVEAPDLAPYRKLDGREVVKAAMRTLERYRPSEAALEDYLTAYAGERFADSMPYVRAFPTELPRLRELLPAIHSPVQIINGLRDAVVPPSNAEYLHQHLPNSRLDLVDSVHFVWEDAADEYATLVTRWWAGGFEDP